MWLFGILLCATKHAQDVSNQMIRLNLISKHCPQCKKDRPLGWFDGKVGMHKASRITCKVCRQYQRDWYKQAGGYAYQKANRIKVRNRVATAGHKICGRCLNEKTESDFITTKGKISPRCEECRDYNARWRWMKRRTLSPEALKKEQLSALTRSRGYRTSILAAYGNKCACCGETTPEFLALDHINNDGAEDRKKVGLAGGAFYSHVLKLGCPPTFRLLCHNCNSSRGYYGYCPHERIAHPVDSLLTRLPLTGTVN